MTWVFVTVAVLAIAGLLAWASLRQRRYSGTTTMDQVRSEHHRTNDPGGGYTG